MSRVMFLGDEAHVAAHDLAQGLERGRHHPEEGVERYEGVDYEHCIERYAPGFSLGLHVSRLLNTTSRHRSASRLSGTQAMMTRARTMAMVEA